MASEWNTGLVREVARSVSETHARDKDELVFLNTSDVLNGKILHHEYTEVASWPGQAKKSIRRNDILFSEIRPANGRFAYVDIDANDYVVSTKLMVIRTDQSLVEPRFLYHFLTQNKILTWLQMLAESRSGTFPQITFDQVAELELPLPSMQEQQVISRFADVLEERITLLTNANATLESIATAIFKSWFVDFDPVRSKADGREPEGMNADTAALFQQSLVESELGTIPRGWKVGPILSIANLLSGGTPKTERAEYWNGGIAWASAKDVSQCRETFLVETERTISDRGLAESSTRLIPEYSTAIVARGATTGRLAILGKTMAMNQTCYALASTNDAPFALHCLIRNMVSQLLQSAHGSVFETITTSTFSGARILLPPHSLLKAYENTAGALFQKILANTELSNTLTSLRDTLLPRLISGKLRMSKAEELVEVVL